MHLTQPSDDRDHRLRKQHEFRSIIKSDDDDVDAKSIVAIPWSAYRTLSSSIETIENELFGSESSNFNIGANTRNLFSAMLEIGYNCKGVRGVAAAELDAIPRCADAGLYKRADAKDAQFAIAVVRQMDRDGKAR